MEKQIRKRAPGAGVKAPDGVTGTERRNVMFDAESLALFEKIGAGNVSLGLREGARRLIESGDTAKFSKKRHKERQQGQAPQV